MSLLNKLKTAAINLSGLGLGIFWIWSDEKSRYSHLGAAKAVDFPESQIKLWNASVMPERVPSERNRTVVSSTRLNPVDSSGETW